jgi:methionyl aminopeptidase
VTGEATEEQARLEGLRNAGALLTEVLDLLQSNCDVGMSAMDIDRIAEEAIRRHGATPAFKGYHGFPSTICWRQKGLLVHGVPYKQYVIESGMMVGIDCGLHLDGWCADACRLFRISGEEDETPLYTAATAALDAGVNECRPGHTIGDIGHAISTAVNDLSHRICPTYGGHYIGREMHEEPTIKNFGEPGKGHVLKVGDVLCIEPIVRQPRVSIHVADDNWTVVTAGGNGCQIEAMVEVTTDCPRILAA